MRVLNPVEVNSVAGAYSSNILANIVEVAACSIGGAVVGSWTLATLGGRSAAKNDLVGIGGGLTALIGMIGGAIAGTAVGAVVAPYYGWDNGLEIAKGLIGDLMQGKPI
ncbi:TPA: hypothetical protein ONC18_004162 [Enterobacter kobei]|nr:hypothetical protein [Enterobacter asburiae]HCR1911404.1 hypothetical protein [Enterobacter kobei]